MKTRSDLAKEHIADLKKYSVETDLENVKEMFKKKGKLKTVSMDSSYKEKIQRREIVLFNLCVKIRDQYFEGNLSSTRHMLTECCKLFFLLNQHSDKVVVPNQLKDCFCDMVKLSNLQMTDMGQGEVCLDPKLMKSIK